MSLLVNEIFKSIQGESTYAGLPCAFLRLTGCNLRCSYCDTQYAYYEGQRFSIDEILQTITSLRTPLVEITGGEPLFQTESILLMGELAQRGFKVLLETNGSLPIKDVDKRVVKIMDIKCPGSGMHDQNLFENIDFLDAKDEIKFVLTDRRDYDWAKEVAEAHGLFERYQVLLGPAFGILDPRTLADWMLADSIPARLNLQLHKYIWETGTRGV